MLNFLIIGIFLTLGALGQWSGKLPKNLSHWLNQFVIYVCLPAIVLLKIPTIAIDQQLLFPSLIPWGVLFFSALVVIVIAKFNRWSKSVTGCLLMLCCFGNTSFFGFPMVNAFFGSQGLPYAIVYDLLGSFLSLAIVGNIILAIYSQESEFSWVKVLLKVIQFPPFIAIFLALALKGSVYPEWITTTLNAISLALVPATMFLVGLHMSVKMPKEIIGPLGFALTFKLVVIPALILVLLISLGQRPDENLAIAVSVFEAAMPPMVTASVMAIHANLQAKLAAAGVGLGLLISGISLPLCYWVIHL